MRRRTRRDAPNIWRPSELNVVSLADTAEQLRNVPGVRIDPRRVVVPARAAFNTTIVFSG